LFAHIYLAAACSSLGREDEARAEVAEVLGIDPKFSLEYLTKTWPFKNKADIERLLKPLRQAGMK
jgi:hypothetical protein